MPANECIPLKTPALSITARCGAAVTGKRFVKVIGNRTGGGISVAGGDPRSVLSTDVENVYVVGPCTVSGEAAVGVAKYDQAINLEVGVYKFGSGHILPVKAGANLTAGQQVQTDATGQAIPLAGGVALGYAMDVATSGLDAEIALY
jgi:hypothetical protein